MPRQPRLDAPDTLHNVYREPPRAGPRSPRGRASRQRAEHGNGL